MRNFRIISGSVLALVCNVLDSSINSCIPVRFVHFAQNLELKTHNICYKFASNPNRPYSSNQLIGETIMETPQNISSSDDAGRIESKRKCDSESVDSKKTKTEDEQKKVRHKQFAILLSYCGVNYFGLQRNANVKTIEGDLFDALLKLNLIKQEHYERPQEFYFQRAARTDKGVSAIKQILSCRMPETFESSIPAINALLPPFIKIIATKKTTKNFDCKNYCDGRTYAYLMPSYALASIDEKSELSYRVNTEQVDSFNRILNKYIGTHNFFNFTSQKTSVDPSAMRYIIKMECGQPFIRKDLEFVQIRVRGQSFMMHQIRKMIGLAIGIMRGYAKEDVIDKAFELQRIDIPKAPGLGLLLEEVHYEKYNKKFSGDGIHEALTWDEYNNDVQAFVEKFIYPVIIDTEINELSMMKWLQLLPIHTFDVREPGPPGPIDIPAGSGDREKSPYLQAAENIDLLTRSVTRKSNENTTKDVETKDPLLSTSTGNVIKEESSTV